MSRRWLSRALVALTVPALLVPALSSPATAAKGAAVPSVAKVAKIYPYLAGGTATQSSDKVKTLGKNCKLGKTVKGAKSTAVSYGAADPLAPSGSATTPWVTVAAMKFRNTKDAVKYLTSSSKAKNCATTVPGGDDIKVSTKKISFKLGDQRWGYTVTVTLSGQQVVGQSLLVRDGKIIVSASATATDGSTPDVKQAIALAKLALKTAS